MTMRLNMMNSSMIFHSIFLRSKQGTRGPYRPIQKRPQLLTDFRNQEDQEMIAKKIKISTVRAEATLLSAYKTKIRMRSPT